jgi:hypothetical protein
MGAHKDRSMARLSIYISEELKARMDAVGDKVNWSEVVRPSLQAEVAVHEHRSNENMETVVERLRASKMEDQQNSLAAGKQEGRDWAGSHATYSELRRVSKIKDGSWSSLRNAVDPNDELVYGDLQNHLFGDTSDPTDDEEYVRGFILGAQELFDEVRGKL